MAESRRNAYRWHTCPAAPSPPGAAELPAWRRRCRQRAPAPAKIVYLLVEACSTFEVAAAAEVDKIHGWLIEAPATMVVDTEAGWKEQLSTPGKVQELLEAHCQLRRPPPALRVWRRFSKSSKFVRLNSAWPKVVRTTTPTRNWTEPVRVHGADHW